MLELYVLTFADKAVDKTLRTEIGNHGATIGRSSECTLHLPDPERHISRVQARLDQLDAGSLRVSNVSNANSIYVAGREILPGNAATLRVGETLGVGLFTLSVRTVPDLSIRETDPPASSRSDVPAASAPHVIASAPLLTQSPISVAPSPMPIATRPPAQPQPANTAMPVPSTSTLGPAPVPPRPELDRVFAPKIGTHDAPTRPFEMNTSAQMLGDPFADLMGNAQAPAIVPSDTSSHRVVGSPSPSALRPSPAAQTKSAAFDKIPDDFDPFALPSAASRNTDDPFSLLQDRDSVSLRGLLDDSASANKLVSDTPIKGTAIDFDPLIGAESAGGQSVDPLSLFGGGGQPQQSPFTDILSAATPSAPSILDRPASELHALTKIAKPIDAPAPAVPNSPQNAMLDPLAAFGDLEPVHDATFDFISSPSLESPVTAPPVMETRGSQPITAPVSPPRQPTADSVPSKRSAALEPTMAAMATPAPLHPQTTSVSTAAADPSSLEARLLKALVDGIGIPALDVPGGMNEELMKKIGEILRVSFDGTVEMMLARALTKREVRTDVTMILAEKNNPIKFAPDGRAAIMQLLGKPFPGFMSHEDAIRDAYEDLHAHEVGVLAGMRAALKAVLTRFNPTALEKKIVSKGAIENVVPQLRKAKLWDAYTDMFGDIVGEAEDDFQSLFGKAFREVYEAEVEKIRKGRIRA